ncbi:unnamed protein product, partial [Phaeothamnion confervicola]
MDDTLYVGTTSTLVGDVTTTVLKQDLSGSSAGASSVTLGTGSSGLSVRALSTTGTLSSLDVILGNLSGSPTTAVTFKDTAVDFYVPVNLHAGPVVMSEDLTVQGNLVVSGVTTTLNTSTISVEDVNIDLANNATTNSMIDGAGLTIGASIGDATPPTLLYASTAETWNTNKTFNVASGKSVTVNDTDAVLSASGL